MLSQLSTWLRQCDERGILQDKGNDRFELVWHGRDAVWELQEAGLEEGRIDELWERCVLGLPRAVWSIGRSPSP